MNSSTNYPYNPVFWLYPDRLTLVNVAAILGGTTTRALIKAVVPVLQALRRMGKIRSTGSSTEPAERSHL